MLYSSDEHFYPQNAVAVVREVPQVAVDAEEDLIEAGDVEGSGVVHPEAAVVSTHPYFHSSAAY